MQTINLSESMRFELATFVVFRSQMVCNNRKYGLDIWMIVGDFAILLLC